MEDDKEDETMEGNNKEDEGNANEDELRQTPSYKENVLRCKYQPNCLFCKCMQLVVRTEL